MLAKNVETLKNMNASTGKFAKLYVRILDPQIISYSFKTKSEDVSAQKFQCVLVSKDPSQYMLGVVPFEFADRQAASKAFAEYRDKTVWEITTPGFDTKSRLEYMGVQGKAFSC